MCLTALMCCVTGAWAVTGSGTESDPYVVGEGETYSLLVKGPDDLLAVQTYATFTAPSDGYVVLTQSFTGSRESDAYLANNNYYMMYSVNGGEFSQTGVEYVQDYVNPVVTRFPVVAGTTYTVRNNTSPSAWSQEDYEAYQNAVSVTVTFEAQAADALDVISAEPAEGSALAGIMQGEKIKVTLNKSYPAFRAFCDNGYNSDNVALVPVEGEENTYEFGPTDLSDLGRDNSWVFYEGQTYTITIEGYNDPDDAFTGQVEPEEITTISYTGTTPAEQYSDIRVINVTPDPNNTTDLENMLSADNHIVTVTFDGIVDSDVQAHINQGFGNTMDVNSIEVNTVDGQSVVTIDVPVSSSDYEIMLAVRATENGMDLNDENPVYEGSFNSGWYTFAMPCAEGRKADMTLGYESLTPADGAYVQSLSELTFTMNNGTDSDGWYGTTSKAKAYVLNAENDTVADVLLSIEGANVTAQICELGSVDYEAGTGTPATITEPGVYRVQIDSLSIGDGNFDVNYPWLSGNTAVGKCNPTWTWTINVVDELVTVNDVDPAPYSVTGEYDAEIPAEVRITMSSANFSVTSATLRYGMNSMENAEYTVESDSVLVVSLSDAARAERHVSLMITAAAENGSPIVYGVENPEEEGQMILLTFQTDRAVFVPGNITPAEGEVESLSTITLEFDSEVGNINYDNLVTITNADGEETTCAMDFDWENYNLAVISVTPEITEDGTYTLVIPERTIFSMESNFGFVDDHNNPEGDLYNPELVYVYTIGEGGTSITGIKADANGNVKVYTIDGVYVGEGAAAETINSLPAGVYIINGTKVAIK